MQTSKQGQRMWYSVQGRKGVDSRMADENRLGMGSERMALRYSKSAAGADGMGQGGMARWIGERAG